MKLSTSSIVASVLFSSFLVAAKPTLSDAAYEVSGAAYFITNDPNGNSIISSKIGSNGKLTFSGAVSAGGVGSHGLPNTNGADGLFSAGSVVVSQSKSLLATVNPGSNTVALFSINAENPTDIHMVGKPVNSGGEFPNSVAFNQEGTALCVLNGGKINGVSCYDVNPYFGLTPAPNSIRSLGLNQTTPATGPPGTPSNIVFSADGSQLIAAVKGFNTTATGFLAIWDVYPSPFISLSKEFKSVHPASGGVNPFQINYVTNNDNALFVADPALGFDIFDFSGSTEHGTDASAVAVPGQGAVCWTVHSSKTGNYYLIDAGTAIVTEVSVNDDLQSSIVKQYPQAAGSGTIDGDIATIGNKDYLYIISPLATSIQVLALNGPGQAENIQALNLTDSLQQAGIPVVTQNLQGMATFTVGGW